MRICLLAPEPLASAASAHSVPALARLLAGRHEVTVIRTGLEQAPADPAAAPAAYRELIAGPSEDLLRTGFCAPDHRHSAAALEAIRAAYGERGPDYLEVPDFRAHGLVPLQARAAGEPLLATTLVGVRVSPSSELQHLHDLALGLPGHHRLAELEREQLRLADRLIWPGGDCLELYRRYYDDLELPEPIRIGAALELPEPPPDPAPAAAGEGPLRILFRGDLRRRRGALDLVEACLGLAADGWELTMVGADTETAQMGQSVRTTIEMMSADDPRIRIEPEAEATALAADHDLLVLAGSLALCDADLIAALAAGLPVLTTPVGDLVEAVEDGVSGWHAEGIGMAPIRRALDRLLADRGELTRVRASGAPARRAAQLADPAPPLAAYEELLGERPAPAVDSAPGPAPLVTAVVPYFRAARYVGEAVASFLDQTHPNLEVVIVNDGSFEAADSVLAEIAADPRVRVVTQVNRGESAARNLGILLARGEYVAMLDADNTMEREFVARAVAILSGSPELAYVASWLRMVGPDGKDTDVHSGFAPLGNRVLAEPVENWDGDTFALLPRRLFVELGFRYGGAMHSDWALYRWLRSTGRYGAVIPERLCRYRVLAESLMRSYPEELQWRGWREARDQELLEAVRWTGEDG